MFGDCFLHVADLTRLIGGHVRFRFYRRSRAHVFHESLVPQHLVLGELLNDVLVELRDTIQYNTIQYNTIQCNAMQCSAVQCSAVQCSAVQCSAVQCSAVQCSAVQCNAMQCGTVRYDTIRYDTIRYDTIRYDTKVLLRRNPHRNRSSEAHQKKIIWQSLIRLEFKFVNMRMDRLGH